MKRPSAYYLLDGEPLGTSLAAFFRLNDFDASERRAMRALQPGQSYHGGGGGWGGFTLLRPQARRSR